MRRLPPPFRRDEPPVVSWVISRLLIAFAFSALLSTRASLKAHDDETQRWLLSWIPSTCCVTNRCCFQIGSADVQAMPNDSWLIVASGQVLKRTNWSPDGNYWRCACDAEQGGWVVRPEARTRCLYVPMPNS